MASTSSQQQQASIELALSLLGSFPVEALTPHLERLECLTRNTRGALSRDSAPTINAVLSDDYLLGYILEFDGSLAFHHKYYNWVVGYEHPSPLEQPNLDIVKRINGTKSNILVCKKWKSMVAGEDGWYQWKAQSKIRVEREIALAKDVAQDASLSWTARICAMAIANDVFALKNAFRNVHRAVSDISCGVGAALEEQRIKDDEDDDSYGFINIDFEPVPRGHPFFLQCCMWNLIEDINDEQDQLYSFTTSIAYAAALVGSLEALQLLNSLDNFPLWRRHFDDKGTGFLSSLVSSACAHPTLDCVVQSISTILSHQSNKGYNNDNVLHARHRGCNGNHLHLAAGRGHTELTKVLIEGGMNPNRRCECIDSRSFQYQSQGGYDSEDYGDYNENYDSDSDEGTDIFIDERDRGVKQFPLPADWASIRGHDAVVQLIYDLSHRSHNGSSHGMSDGVKRGHAKRFNTERGFGFIKPDDGGKDVFVHISNINNSAPLEENEYVEFTTEITNRGIGALDVTRVAEW